MKTSGIILFGGAIITGALGFYFYKSNPAFAESVKKVIPVINTGDTKAAGNTVVPDPIIRTPKTIETPLIQNKPVLQYEPDRTIITTYDNTATYDMRDIDLKSPVDVITQKIDTYQQPLSIEPIKVLTYTDLVIKEPVQIVVAPIINTSFGGISPSGDYELAREIAV